MMAHLATSALAFALHFLEIGYHHYKQLYHDGCSDVGHDTEGENGCVGESTTREHVQQTQDTVAGLVLQARKLAWINTRKDNIGSYTVHQHEAEGVEYALAQILDRPNVL